MSYSPIKQSTPSNVPEDSRAWAVSLYKRFEKQFNRANANERALLHRELEDEVSEFFHERLVKGKAEDVAEILTWLKKRISDETESDRVISDSIIANTARFHCHRTVKPIRTEVLHYRATNLANIHIT